ncbi:MAG: 23S rRNA (pseudouridine(1915)-N(3))-methyltransferase RlmH [Clostridiales bacterium]|nr:23S rRNA (pseudouridine(1915)-N(3))-methyltransferase RlmH [Clostridiales bacterium]
MKKITVLCVGKLAKPFCRDGCDEYLKRLRSFYDMSIVEIAEQPTVKREGEELSKRMSGESVLLDIGGDELSSEQFADLIKSAHERADKITFIIGGASGVDGAVRDKCARRVSFGRVTYPHQIARLLLVEQIYRAATINNGLPYHK